MEDIEPYLDMTRAVACIVVHFMTMPYQVFEEFKASPTPAQEDSQGTGSRDLALPSPRRLVDRRAIPRARPYRGRAPIDDDDDEEEFGDSFGSSRLPRNQCEIVSFGQEAITAGHVRVVKGSCHFSSS